MKKPFRFLLENDEPYALAGLWDEWTSPHGDTVHSFSIITTEPNSLLAKIHDRMPVILDPSDEIRWLTTPPERAEELLPMLKPFPSGRMKTYAVSPKMNSSHYKEKDCVLPIEETSGSQGSFHV